MWRKLSLLFVLMALLSACDSSSPYDIGDEVIVHLNAQGNVAWVTKGNKNYTIDVSNHSTAKIDQSSVDILAPNDLNQANYPTGWIFPDGLPAFTIYDLAPAGGDSLTVTITCPSAYPAGAVYYKATANGFAPYTPAVISGNTVLLPLTDGGSGDSDAVNGQITDPGGPAVCKSIGWAVGDATGGYGTILKTTDGGMNWVRQGNAATVPDANLNGVAVLDKDTLWVVGDFSEGFPTILRSEDGGQTWVRQGENDNLPQSGLLDIYALNRDEAWAVGDGGTIIHTDNGGASWHVQGAGQVPEAPYQGVFALDKNRIWVTGGPDPEDGVIAHSQNGGATWEEYDFQGGLHVYCFVPRLLQSGVGWISGHDRVVYHTTDFGQTWEAYQHLDLPTGTDLNNVVAINDTTAWIAADMGIIFYTTDGNKTWHMQRPACAAGFYLMGVDAMDTRTIWMAGATSGGPSDAGVIIHTQNAGEQWVRQHTPTNVRYWDIAFAR